MSNKTMTQNASARAIVKARIYRNVVILPAYRNSSGIRWIARLNNGDRLRADTLQGIRQMIREYLDVRAVQS